MIEINANIIKNGVKIGRVKSEEMTKYNLRKLIKVCQRNDIPLFFKDVQGNEQENFNIYIDD